MQQNSDNIAWLYPSTGVEDPGRWRLMGALEPFCNEAIDFLNALSGVLMHNARVRTFPDVITFAFFCRRANILKLKAEYQSNFGAALRLGRGVVFHIAPSNVPVNFAYSLICGVLSGNVNLIRIPSREFEQVEMICQAIAQVLSDRQRSVFSERLALIRYERGASATDTLSALCDVRVIWGGDATIETVRKSSIPPRAFDVTFADRYSICVIDARAYLAETLPEKVAENFYNDTYLFDQNACSAPHLVMWRGDAKIVEQAKERFWKALHDYTVVKYELSDILAVDKLTTFYSQAIKMDICKKQAPDNLIWRVEAASLPANIDTYRCKAGYFTEYRIDTLSEIAHIINRKYQTMAYFGVSVEELKDFMRKERPSGLDRIVPIGKTTEFGLVWDSYDLIATLTREITVL